VTPLMAGVTYERLEGYKTLQWPVAADGSDQPLLYTTQFKSADGKATFYFVHGPSRAISRTRSTICT